MNPIRVAGADDKTLYPPPTDRALIDVAGLNEQRGQSGAAGVRARSEFQVVLPVLAKRGFGGNADAYGFLTAAFGAGAMIGGLVVAGRRTPRRRAVVVAAAAFRARMLAATWSRIPDARRYRIPVLHITLWMLGGITELGAEPCSSPRARCC
jgi:hypothetical protein